MPAIRLITLDLDDTLWPCLPVIQAAEQQLYAWLQQHAPALAAAHDITSLRAHRLALAETRPALAHDLTALRTTHLALLLAEHGHDPALARAGTELFRRARNRVTPYPEVTGALRRLRREHLLVSLTNGNAQVEHTPLAGCFHLSLMAEQVGAAKPDPALFHAACDWAGVSPAQTLHIGDDPRRDVQPARALGMRTAWINRGDAPWPGDLPPPAWQFSDLAALADALSDLNEDALP